MKRSSRTPSAATLSHPRRRRRAVQYLLAFLAVVIVIDALVGEKGWFATRRADQEYARSEAALNQVRADNARLREEARRLKEDPSVIEDIARRDLGLIKPGEQLFIVREARPAEGRPPDTAPSTPESSPQ